MIYQHGIATVSLVLPALLMLAAVAAACIIKSTDVLIHDTATYDAGIPASHHSPNTLSMDALMLI